MTDRRPLLARWRVPLGFVTALVAIIYSAPTWRTLWIGLAFIAVGVMLAANSLVVAVVGTIYIVATIGTAIRTEERFLRQAFGDTYARYERSEAEPMHRRFSVERAMRNREYRAAVGLVGGFALLALKVAVSV